MTTTLDELSSNRILRDMMEHSRQEMRRTLFSINRSGIRFTISIDEEGPSTHQIHILGRDAPTRKILRNALIGRSRLQTNEHDEIHWMQTYNRETAHDRLGQTILKLIDEIGLRVASTECRTTLPRTSGLTTASMYWWDSVSNFGDILGPWIVGRRYDILPINNWRTPRSGVSLTTAGSIIPLISTDNTYIWGSGMLSPLTQTHVEKLNALQNTVVLATRGHLSAEQLKTKLNWSVPNIHGDPALLSQRYFKPSTDQKQQGKISVVCHWEHQKYASGGDDRISYVNVKDGPERVISIIANSRACVSTSLHGLIVAQAYGVPWTWLRIDGNQLHSTDFKFEDFFTTIDRDAVSTALLEPERLAPAELLAIAEGASIPNLKTDLDELDRSLTHWAYEKFDDRPDHTPLIRDARPRSNSSFNRWLPRPARQQAASPGSTTLLH